MRTCDEVLCWGREVVDPALRVAVDRLPATARRVAGYHLGWWDADGEPADGDGGKALRPALCLLAAAAIGSDAAVAVPAAVAIELVHNFSLLHDDVMDGDVRRRHRPTAWTVFGLGPAILAGDALLTAAFDALAASGHPQADVSVRCLSATVLALVDGQSLDLEFEARDDVVMAEAIRMANAKTGSLLGCACALGAMFAGAPRPQVDQVRLFGERLGFAFQLVDDILGIWGDPALTGKPVHADLASRKKSLPVVAALGSDTPAGAELAELYRHIEPLTPTELAYAAQLIEQAGARAWTENQAADQLTQAFGHLQSADLSGPAVGELTALAYLVTSREH
ncbi:MAG TPA: family 2 encapsulin nanocompartment cargo protein polyprenyl transferase [Solirubrobacteraceae bacterium]